MTLRRTLTLFVVAIGLALAALLGIARATPPVGMSGEMLGKGTTDDGFVLEAKGTVENQYRLPNGQPYPWRATYKAPWDVTTVRVTLPPGASTGWHRHSGPGFMIVTQGAVTLYTDYCDRTTYAKGEAFLEVPGLPSLLRNDGSETAVFVGTFVVPATASVRLDVATPPCIV